MDMGVLAEWVHIALLLVIMGALLRISAQLETLIPPPAPPVDQTPLPDADAPPPFFRGMDADEQPYEKAKPWS